MVDAIETAKGLMLTHSTCKAENKIKFEKLKWTNKLK